MFVLSLTKLTDTNGWHALGIVLSCLCFVSSSLSEDRPPTAPASGALTPGAQIGKPAPPAAHRGYLGVTLTEICPEVRAQTTLKPGEGLMIGRVAPESPAAAFGLQHYDILTKLNDQWIMSPAQLITLVENAGPGSEIELTVLRRRATTTVHVTLAPLPASPVVTSPAASPDEMLTSVIRLLRNNPVELETVHRLLHTARGGLDGMVASIKAGSRVTLHDDAGEVEITLMDGLRQVRAWDKAGMLLFEGPCSSTEEHQAIPETLRPRVERLLEECRNPKERRPASSGRSEGIRSSGNPPE